MKKLTFLLLSSVASALFQAQAQDPPILAPNFQDGLFFQGDKGKEAVPNDGSAGGLFIAHQGDGTLEVAKSDLGDKKVLKLSPTAVTSHSALNLPCLVFEEMPPDFPRGITLQARIKPDPDWLLPSVDVFCGRSSDRGPGIGVLYRPESRLVDVLSGPGGYDQEVWGIVSKSESAIPAYSWAHIAAVYDPEAKQFRLYVNGELAVESEKGLALTPLDKTFAIGAYRGGYAYPFRGEIADIAVYDYVRSPEQIRADAAENTQ